MFFTSPIWLLGLLPWSGVVVYLFTGQPDKQAVPFLRLWAGTVVAPKRRRALHRPPGFIVLLILSMLLALLAAAGPVIHSTLGSGEITTIILDRGITMSPSSGDGKPFRGVLGIAERLTGAIDLVPVPGTAVRCTGSDWIQIAQRLTPTALDTQAMMDQAVAEKLRSSTGLVIVLTDRELEGSSDRLVQIAPEESVEDVGIADVGARSKPSSQVMVRLRNQSKLDSAPVRITSGSQTLSRVVKLPAAGETKDFFFDMAEPLGDMVAVEINAHDVAPVNDRAWLVREKSWPIIEARTVLPESVTKLIDIYSKTRLPGTHSLHIAVANHPLTSEENGVWLVSGAGSDDSKATVVSPHPVTQDITHWPGAGSLNESLPAGFEAIVSRAGMAIVGVRREAGRQVWVNLNLESWSRTPDFVIFFANVFDWINAGRAEEFVGHRVSQMGESSLWPGLYRGADGGFRAVNSPDVRWSAPPITHWREKLAHSEGQNRSGSSLGAWFCLGALVCATAAVLVWRSADP
jgi:hypothetical protein